MTRRARGQCLIMNNIIVDDGGDRIGSEVDERMSKVLFEQLGFRVSW